MKSTVNPSLRGTDAYKQFHMLGYAPGTEYVYSYLCARSDKNFKECVFFGLQYYLKEFLSKPITPDDVAAFLEEREAILGPTPREVVEKFNALAALGYWPLKIDAIPEGTIVPVKNALLTITNTVPGFGWCVGYVESLLLKVWFPIQVATNVLQYKNLLSKYFNETEEEANAWLQEWLVCDFGYRSCDSEQAAEVSGAAHLVFFKGSDTIPALNFVRKNYGVANIKNVMASVPASEHSVACSYTKDGEFAYFEQMLELVPEGIVSIVSDTYDIYKVCTEFLPALKDRIMARNGKVVIRPDSGYPEYIICGDPNAEIGTPQSLGVLRLLDMIFGSTVNGKGYRVLDSHIGLIYGEGITLERYNLILNRMKDMGYASSNLVIGVGGILRAGNRDTLGFALKATAVTINGVDIPIFKDPITGADKKSHRGYMKVVKNEQGKIVTVDGVDKDEINCGLLRTVFLDGKLIKHYTFDEVRANANC